MINPESQAERDAVEIAEREYEKYRQRHVTGNDNGLLKSLWMAGYQAAWKVRAAQSPAAAPVADSFGALLGRLMGEFQKHPQLKPIIGREALILRCVDAAQRAAPVQPTPAPLTDELIEEVRKEACAKWLAGGHPVRGPDGMRIFAKMLIARLGLQVVDARDGEQRAAALEATMDRMCERLVMAVNYISPHRREAFEGEWKTFMKAEAMKPKEAP